MNQLLVKLAMIWDPDFKGYIHDVGGPTANFRQGLLVISKINMVHVQLNNLWPKACNNLEVSHQ